MYSSPPGRASTSDVQFAGYIACTKVSFCSHRFVAAEEEATRCRGGAAGSTSVTHNAALHSSSLVNPPPDSFTLQAVHVLVLYSQKSLR